MKEYHCQNPECDVLLFKGKFIGEVEVVCCNCGHLFKISKMGTLVMSVDNKLPDNAFVLTQVG